MTVRITNLAIVLALALAACGTSTNAPLDTTVATSATLTTNTEQQESPVGFAFPAAAIVGDEAVDFLETIAGVGDFADDFDIPIQVVMMIVDPDSTQVAIFFVDNGEPAEFVAAKAEQRAIDRGWDAGGGVDQDVFAHVTLFLPGGAPGPADFQLVFDALQPLTYRSSGLLWTAPTTPAALLTGMDPCETSSNIHMTYRTEDADVAATYLDGTAMLTAGLEIEASVTMPAGSVIHETSIDGFPLYIGVDDDPDGSADVIVTHQACVFELVPGF